MIISLIGFMASGKTTVGKQLAERLDYEFIDLDQYIENITKRKVKDIFNKKGEKHFRSLEKKSLKKVLKKADNLVISPGGGIVLEQTNIALLKKKTVPFLLKVSPETILKRIDEISERPLLDYDSPAETVKKLLDKRKKYYDQFNNVVVTDSKKPEQIVGEIINRLESLQ